MMQLNVCKYNNIKKIFVLGGCFFHETSMKSRQMETPAFPAVICRELCGYLYYLRFETYNFLHQCQSEIKMTKLHLNSVQQSTNMRTK